MFYEDHGDNILRREYVQSQLTGVLTSTLLTSDPSLRFPLSAAVPDNEALCVDLSPGYIYASMNSSSNDFLVRLMGGGGCVTDEVDCAAGTREGGVLYSSAGMPTTSTGFGVLSGDATENPLFSTYNRIMVPYCTQDMFLMDTESSDGELQFRGRRYLE